MFGFHEEHRHERCWSRAKRQGGPVLLRIKVCYDCGRVRMETYDGEYNGTMIRAYMLGYFDEADFDPWHDSYSPYETFGNLLAAVIRESKT